jgi:predicted acetylornithine/succinylornithine family transaminase
VTDLLTDTILPTYARAPVTFVEGDGLWLVDDQGERYLDFSAGIAVLNLGHRRPEVVAAAHAQLDRLWHASNLYWTLPMVELSRKLSDRFGGPGAQAFFCNSGAEAIEAALKYARKATGKPGIVALEGSFHGRTTGAVAITGQAAKREPFAPLLPGVAFAQLNDLDSLAAAVGSDTGLIVLEPVQGEGGINPLDADFLALARELADEHGALLCLDEIQTGMGRTGTFFAFEQTDVRPDLVTLAKGLANGLPIGALLVSNAAPRGFVAGDHASTFGGNLVASAAACAVVDLIDDDLLQNVQERGEQLRAGLAALPGVTEARGAGLLVAAQTEKPAAEVVAAALEQKLVTTVAGDAVRLTPPLTVSAELVDRALEILGEVLAS